MHVFFLLAIILLGLTVFLLFIYAHLGPVIYVRFDTNLTLRRVRRSYCCSNFLQIYFFLFFLILTNDSPIFSILFLLQDQKLPRVPRLVSKKYCKALSLCLVLGVTFSILHLCAPHLAESLFCLIVTFISSNVFWKHIPLSMYHIIF